MSVDEQNWYRIAIALGIGLLIGIERERRKGEGPQRAVAGMRTFAVVALLGAVSVILGDEVLLAVVAAGVTLLVAIGYRRTFRGDPGLT
ncbi:MAG: MgtC/SapB family protein, partial [Betaproteobacteria bacterium]|nr:MgtC/SapB family protein [Betaproteobacteria bacterium]